MNGLDGSTETTPTLRPSARTWATREPTSDDLPTPGGPVTPTDAAGPSTEDASTISAPSANDPRRARSRGRARCGHREDPGDERVLRPLAASHRRDSRWLNRVDMRVGTTVTEHGAGSGDGAYLDIRVVTDRGARRRVTDAIHVCGYRKEPSMGRLGPPRRDRAERRSHPGAARAGGSRRLRSSGCGGARGRLARRWAATPAGRPRACGG